MSNYRFIHELKKSLSFILLFALLLSNISLSASAAASDAPHQYLTDSTNPPVTGISWQRINDSDKQVYLYSTGPDRSEFSFNPEQTEYNIMIADGTDSTSKITATLKDAFKNDPLYGRFANGATGISATGRAFTKGVYLQASLNSVKTTDTVKMDSTSPYKLKFVVGKLASGNAMTGTYKDTDTYTFNVYRMAALTKFIVAYDDKETETPSLSPEFKTSPVLDKNASAYINKFTVSGVRPGTTALYVTAPAVTQKDTKLYFGNTGNVWTEGKAADGTENTNPATTPYKLDLTQYTPEENGTIIVPFKLDYQGSGCGVDSYYTLYISFQDYTPKLTDVPENVEADKDTDLTLSFSIDEIGAPSSLSYQWYSGSSAIRLEKLEGATTAAYKPSTALAGSMYYRCEVKRTAGGVVYTADTGLIKVTVLPTYLTKPAITIEPPGTADYKNEYAIGQAPIALRMGYDSSKLDKLSGINVSAKLYRNTVDSTEGGELVAEKSVTGSTVSITPPAEDTPGTWWYYIVLNAYTGEYPGTQISSDAKSETVKITFRSFDGLISLSGDGTEESPWLIGDYADLCELKRVVDGGNSLAGRYIKLAADLSLEDGWDPIGCLKPGSVNAGDGKNINPFGGTFDGAGYTITVADGGKPLFAYVRGATVKNLNIFGTYIESNGLVSNYTVDYGPEAAYVYMGHPTINILNVTIKSGTTIKDSGFIGGYASGSNLVTIRDCTVEKGVTIGWDKDAGGPALNARGVGSFGGSFNGYVINSASYAKVYGKDNVGGLVGGKGQAMGPCDITNSVFGGEVIATGSFVGGIIGGGYNNETASNTKCVVVENCYVTGNVTGGDYIGGIFGGEGGSVQSWDNGVGYIRNNYFSGTVTSEKAKYIGGIIGYMNSVNKYNVITNNYYLDGCGANKGLGGALYIDTSHASPAVLDGTVYIDTSTGFSGISGIDKPYSNRTDDPLGADADKLNKSVTASYLSGDEIIAALNAGEGSWKNWVSGVSEGKAYPVHNPNALAVINKLTIEGNLKSIYYLGDTFSAENMIITAHRTDGTTTLLSAGDVNFSGFDSSTTGLKTVTVNYEGVQAFFTVSVIKNYKDDVNSGNTISVKFVLIGSSRSSEDIDLGTGDYKNAKYETWIPMGTYKMDKNSTVLELFARALSETGLEFSLKSSDNYIDRIKSPNGKWLAEFTNGPRSGWMYTVGRNANGSDGSHPNLSLREYVLKDGYVIIWHYVNDYSYEIPDWRDEAAYPKLGDGTYHSKWLEVLNGGSPVTPAEQGSSTLTPKSTVKDGAAKVTVNTADMNKAIENTKKNSGSVITVKPEIIGKANNTSVELPKTSLAAIASDTKADLKIVTPNGNVTIPNDALNTLTAQSSGGTVAIVIGAVENTSLTAEQQKLVGDNSVFDISILSGDKHISSFDGKSITISLPYTLKNGESTDGVTVWYLSDKGELQKMACKYEKATGLATFTTNHLSSYVVGCEVAWTNPFTDVKAGDWFYDAVKFAAQMELFNGTSATTFGPDSEMTRAMLVTVLYRLEGKPASAGTNNFNDVKSGEWYTDAVLWASANGIITGYSNSQFGPNDPITREQMAAIIYRFAILKKYNTSKSNDLSAYTDANAVTTYAVYAMKWANAEHLITGRTATTLAPAGMATRAEVASILMRFVENVTKQS